MKGQITLHKAIFRLILIYRVSNYQQSRQHLRWSLCDVITVFRVLVMSAVNCHGRVMSVTTAHGAVALAPGLWPPTGMVTLY